MKICEGLVEMSSVVCYQLFFGPWRKRRVESYSSLCLFVCTDTTFSTGIALYVASKVTLGVKSYSVVS
jgi:hypothetical protein